LKGVTRPLERRTGSKRKKGTGLPKKKKKIPPGKTAKRFQNPENSRTVPLLTSNPPDNKKKNRTRRGHHSFPPTRGPNCMPQIKKIKFLGTVGNWKRANFGQGKRGEKQVDWGGSGLAKRNLETSFRESPPNRFAKKHTKKEETLAMKTSFEETGQMYLSRANLQRKTQQNQGEMSSNEEK